ncbi:MAG: hypothetical protein AAF004_16175 [Pseudomonadota bacterium]
MKRLLTDNTRLLFAAIILPIAAGIMPIMSGCAASPGDPDHINTRYPLANHERVGTLDFSVLPEASGLAISPTTPTTLWLVNDAGNDAELIAIDTPTMTSRVLEVAGIRNRDWEDLASFVRDDRSWLAIADVGDNNAVRDSVAIIFVPEPAVGATTAENAMRVVLTYPDGARDVEAIAVDAKTDAIYALSKRTKPAVLYRISLTAAMRAATADEPMQWQRLGEINSIPQPTALEIKLFPKFGKYRAQPVAMDVSPDGRRIALLTYGEAYVAVVGENGDWLEALNGTLHPVAMPVLPQPETIAVDNQGVIWITTEQRDAPLLRFTPSPHSP